jgi:hypothetical protein
MRGNCYVTCESLYHLLGARASGWSPYVMRLDSDTHWFLKHDSGVILDPTVAQFSKPPDYSLGRRTGFLTRVPSKRAKVLMDKMLWNER